MKNHNLALLSEDKRRNIELDRQASLLIRSFKRGKITRANINIHIDNLGECEREIFREKLNKYKKIKGV